MGSVTVRDVLVVFERACMAKNKLTDAGFFTFFPVREVNRLVDALPPDFGFKRIERKENALSLPVDDIRDLCTILLEQMVHQKGD